MVSQIYEEAGLSIIWKNCLAQPELERERCIETVLDGTWYAQWGEFEGLSSEMRSKVDSAVSSATQLFDARVGVGVMDFIQMMDSEPFTVALTGSTAVGFKSQQSKMTS
jgi:hypothetical protein